MIYLTQYLTRVDRPQTPGRSLTLNNAEAYYPTPESHPRKLQSHIHDNAAQAGPRIPALGLSTPADTESNDDNSQDANEEMAVDEVPLTSRERDFLHQVLYSLVGMELGFDRLSVDFQAVQNNRTLRKGEREAREREHCSQE
jgi:hypothetical protein